MILNEPVECWDCFFESQDRCSLADYYSKPIKMCTAGRPPDDCPLRKDTFVASVGVTKMSLQLVDRK